MPEPYKSAIPFRYIPSLRWYWHWYAITILVVLLAVLWETSYQSSRKQNRYLRNRQIDRFKKYRERVGTQNVPESKHQPTQAPLAPNVVCESTDTIEAHRGYGGIICDGKQKRSYQSDPDTNVLAVVARYRNKVKSDGQPIGGRGNISAKVAYTSYSENTKGQEANRATWLSDEKFRVVFGINDPHTLVIAAFEQGNLYAIKEDPHGSLEQKVKYIELDGDLFGANVELISESESKIISTNRFMLEVVRGKRFAVTLTEIFAWKRDKLAGLALEAHDIAHKATSDNNEELESEFENWKLKVSKFLARHLGADYKKRFLPLQPAPEFDPAWRRYVSRGLEPPTLEGKILAKTTMLKLFIDELWAEQMRQLSCQAARSLVGSLYSRFDVCRNPNPKQKRSVTVLAQQGK
jgi:hypothetical protein